jgi:LytS/YehU family sensor histidine kinase
LHGKTKSSFASKIIDNGKGFYPKTDEKLHALEIIKTRLKLNNPNDEASFTSKTEQMFRVRKIFC